MPPKPKVPKKTAADRAREAEELHQAQLEEARVAAAKLKREKEAREAEDAAILKVQVEARRIEMSGERDDCRERTMVNRNVMRRKRDEQEQELQVMISPLKSYKISHLYSCVLFIVAAILIRNSE